MTTLKVGQKVRCPWGTYPITKVENGHAFVGGWDGGKVICVTTGSGTLHYNWELAEGEGGECLPSRRDPADTRCYCERAGFPADRYVSHGTNNCTTGPYYEGEPCPPRVEQAKPIDRCAALCASLPTSETYLVGLGADEAACRERARQNLRSRLAGLREWPVCPTSGEALRIRTLTKTTRRGPATRKGGAAEALVSCTAVFGCKRCRGAK